MIVHWERVFEDFTSRLSGPLHLRLLLQPGMALLVGIRDGLKDARESRPAYLWSIIRSPSHRVELLSVGLKSVAKILILAFVLDTTFQAIVRHTFYAGEAAVVALMLAFVPYALIRGPVNRIVSQCSSFHASRNYSYDRKGSTASTSRTARNQR